ncbi:RnfH family protein [Aurantivibrio plasticivorans]
MKVSVVYAGYTAQSWIELNVDDDCIIRDVIEQSGILSKFPEIDLDSMKVGVHGKVTPLKKGLSEGDRVEIYRPITRVLDDDDDDDD